MWEKVRSWECLHGFCLKWLKNKLPLTEMAETADRSVVGGEGEKWGNRGSEEMHIRTLFGTGYTRTSIGSTSKQGGKETNVKKQPSCSGEHSDINLKASSKHMMFKADDQPPWVTGKEKINPTTKLWALWYTGVRKVTSEEGRKSWVQCPWSKERKYTEEGQVIGQVKRGRQVGSNKGWYLSAGWSSNDLIHGWPWAAAVSVGEESPTGIDIRRNWRHSRRKVWPNEEQWMGQ